MCFSIVTPSMKTVISFRRGVNIKTNDINDEIVYEMNHI